MLNILITVFGIILLVFAWIMLYDSNRFVVVKHMVTDKRIQKSFRVAVLADLHNKRYGKNNENLLQAIKECRPDMVLIAGDMLTAKKGKTLDIALELLRELAKEYPIYYGNGNHEHRLKLYPKQYGDMGEKYFEALKEMGINNLVNAHVTFPEYGMELYGAEIDRSYYRRFRVWPMNRDYLRKTLGTPDAGKYCILLAHNPDYFPQYAEWGADMVFSGHVHGGMVRVPFWGKGVVSPNVRLFPKYDGGEFHQDKSTMLLSRGLGMHTIPIRLFNPGEVLVVEFAPQNDKDRT